MSVERWNPISTKSQLGCRPSIGDVVGIGRSAWQITNIEDLPLTAEDHVALSHYKPERRFERGPFKAHLRRIYGPAHEQENSRQEVTLTLPANNYYRWDIYPDERVPLCSCCQHPWPCLITDSIRDAAQAAELMNKKLERATPGCCYSCGEVISTRQETISYPEPNVEIPGFPPPRFHARQSCAGGRRAYEESRKNHLPDVAAIASDDKTPPLWAETKETP